MPMILRTKSGWVSAGSITAWGYVATVLNKETGEVLGRGASKRSLNAAKVKACKAAGVRPSSFVFPS